MAAQVNSTGRYVMYDLKVDSALEESKEAIQEFKAEQRQNLLLEDCPYNLSSESGRLLAMKEIKNELSEKIEIFSHEAFQQAAKDIAFSIVAKIVTQLR